MDKSLLSISLATATATTTVPVITLTTGGSYIERKPNWNNSASLYKLTNSSDVKHKYSNVKCLQDYFKGSSYWRGNLQNSKADIVFIDNDDNLKGCFELEYYKQEYEESKWWGEFKLVWSVASDNQVLIISLNSKTDNKNLFVDYSAYIVVKSTNSWSLYYEIENKNHLISKKDELSKWFPKLSDTDLKEHWNLDDKFEKICGFNECGSTSYTTHQKSIILNLDKSKKNKELKEWSSNFSDWFDNWFSDWSDVKKKLEELRGDWIKNS